jgi:hypothetical protein
LDYGSVNLYASLFPNGIQGVQMIVKIELKSPSGIAQFSMTLERELHKEQA